jgi:DNA-binding NarL/FixJ family response regulator
MTDVCRLRVLIIDDDADYCSKLTPVLSSHGFEVFQVEGVNEALYTSALQQASLHRPHVVVMDLRLFDTIPEKKTGLDLWKDEIFSSSNTRCILNSAFVEEDFHITRNALLQYKVDDVLSKGDHPSLLIEAIENSGRKECACRNKVFTIHWPTAWNEGRVITTLFPNDPTIPPSLVTDVIGRLFPEARSIHLQNLGGEARSPDSIIRGRYVILQAQPDDRQSAIIKLAPARHTGIEVKAYNDHIRERLEGGFYSHINKSHVFWELGGINYSLIGSSDPDVRLFRDHFRHAKSVQAVFKPLEHFFHLVWSKHYLAKSPLERSLYDAYDEFFHLTDKLNNLPSQADTFSMPGIPIDFPNPISWLLRHKQDSDLPNTMKSVTHGDLHGDNLFADSDHAWAIDFERSGPGPILRDFVEIEEDICIRLSALPDDDPKLFLRLMVDLLEQQYPEKPFDLRTGYSKGDASADMVRAVVVRLRKLARETTGCLDMQEYYWGLLFDALFGGLLAKKDSLSYKRNLLMAAMVCVRLRDWKKPWPPAEWGLERGH